MLSDRTVLWLLWLVGVVVGVAGNADVCTQPSGVVGRCRAAQWRFTFDNQNKMCVAFTYGGCGGNDNNFESISSCESACSGHVKVKAAPLEASCHLPAVTGSKHCLGYFPMFTYNAVDGLCEAFTYGGCGGSLNLYHTMDQCMARCVTGPPQPVGPSARSSQAGVRSIKAQPAGAGVVENICRLPPVWPGPMGCMAFMEKWTYSWREAACVRYLYGGCRGTDNLFDTSEECEASCAGSQVGQERSADVCALPISTGPCKAAKWVFGFNQKTGRCEQFIYGGCGGNANNFDTIEGCVNTCGGGEPTVSQDCHGATCDKHEEDFHRAKGCLPVTKPGECCPSSWDCSPWERRMANKTLCFYSSSEDPVGKMYNIGDSIDGVRAGCRAGCRCVKGPAGTAEIICAVYDCAPQSPAFSWDRCVPQYDNLDQCCMPGFKCDDDKSGLAECNVDGNTYLEGQKIYPKSDPCLVCLCHAGWDGSMSAPACHRVDCVLQLNGDKLLRGCTPVYRDDVCCPTDWICPDQVTAADAVITGRNVNTAIQPEDRCLLPKDFGPCEAIIPAFYFDINSRKCLSFNYGGCQGNENRFDSEHECTNTCQKYSFKTPMLAGSAQEQCTAQKQPGPCKGNFKRWHHDAKTGKCQQFIYGGCKGNENNFNSLDECEARCNASPGPAASKPGKAPACNQPVTKGRCRSRIEKFYYDQNTGLCKQFYYSGCQGGSNMFDDLESCMQTCVQPDSLKRASAGQDLLISNPCDQEKDIGPCRAAMQRWFFNKACQTCQNFFYGGCLGNENNFKTQAECESKCFPKLSSSFSPSKDRIITVGGVNSLPARVGGLQGVAKPGPGCNNPVSSGSGRLPMPMPGGPMPMPGGLQDAVIDKEVKLAAVTAVRNLASVSFITGTQCNHVHLIEVMKASRQIVQGTNFQLTLRLGVKGGSSCDVKQEKTCSNIVVFKPLPHACREAHGCLQVNSANADCVHTEGDRIISVDRASSLPAMVGGSGRLPMPMPGGPMPMPGGLQDAAIDKEVKLAAVTAVRNLASVNFITGTQCNHVHLIEVMKASRQIVAGTNFHLTLRLGVKGGSSCEVKQEKSCSNIVVFKPLPHACREAHGCLQVNSANADCVHTEGDRIISVDKASSLPAMVGGSRQSIAGGFSQANIDNDIIKIGQSVSTQLAGANHVTGDECNHAGFVQVEDVMIQVVAGTNYVFRLRINTKSGPRCNQDQEKICSNIKVFKPLPYACAQDDGCLEVNSLDVICRPASHGYPILGGAPSLPAKVGGSRYPVLGGFSSVEVDEESRSVADSVTSQLADSAIVTGPQCNHVELVEIVEASRQVVAGTNFIFTLKMKTKSGSQCTEVQEKTCSKIKVFKPLPYACSEDHGCLQLDTTHVSCITGGPVILGGFSSVHIDSDINKIGRSVSTQLSVANHVTGDECNHAGFIQVEDVKSQVVAGTNYVFTLRINAKSGPGCDQDQEKICSNIKVFKPLPYACSQDDGCLEVNSLDVTCRPASGFRPRISAGRAVTLPERIGPGDPCTLDKEVGPCRASMPRFFFDKSTRTCQKFIFGGCRDNANNFKTLEACEARCGRHLVKTPRVGVRRRPTPKNPICQMSMDTGPCFALMPRFYFNFSSRRCESFQYGGCQGNANNFPRMVDCVSACGKHPRSLPGQAPPEAHIPSPKCHFGNSTYQVGDILRFDSDPCNSCICSSPPNLTCRKKTSHC